MKKQVEFSKLLDLGKEDIANLSENEQSHVVGGQYPPSAVCPTYRTCPPTGGYCNTQYGCYTQAQAGCLTQYQCPPVETGSLCA